MESKIIELNKTNSELFEYQSNHYEKEFNNSCIMQAMLLHSGMCQ
jgi:hypothetical protein